MVEVIERIAGRYEAQEVEDFAKVYKWHPASVVVECECGEMLTLTRSMTICECGVDHVADIQEELVVQLLEEDGAVCRPWRYWHSSKDSGIPF